MSKTPWLVFVACLLVLPETSRGKVRLVEVPQIQDLSRTKLASNSALSTHKNLSERYNDDQILKCKRIRQMTYILGNKTVTYPTDLVRCKPLPEIFWSY